MAHHYFIKLPNIYTLNIAYITYILFTLLSLYYFIKCDKYVKWT